MSTHLEELARLREERDRAVAMVTVMYGAIVPALATMLERAAAVELGVTDDPGIQDAAIDDSWEAIQQAARAAWGQTIAADAAILAVRRAKSKARYALTGDALGRRRGVMLP